MCSHHILNSASSETLPEDSGSIPWLQKEAHCHTDVLLQARECDSLKTLLVRKSQQLVLWRTLRMLIAEIIPDQL